jgi:hypothetical protein
LHIFRVISAAASLKYGNCVIDAECRVNLPRHCYRGLIEAGVRYMSTSLLRGDRKATTSTAGTSTPFKVIDANGQAPAFVYSHEGELLHVPKGLSEDEARRIASNIAKLPVLLGKGS